MSSKVDFEDKRWKEIEINTRQKEERPKSELSMIQRN
jgi:hypothetical protein